MFSNTEWWKEDDSPIKKRSTKTSKNDDVNNYGSIPTSYQPLDDDSLSPCEQHNSNDTNSENENQWESGATSLFENYVDTICIAGCDRIDSNGFLTQSNKSSITNSDSYGSGCCDDNDNGHDESDDESVDSNSNEEFDDDPDEEIEPPHKTLGLIFFDFLRFIAVMANFRLIGTQIVPVFLVRKMGVLHVALRIYMTVFAILNITLEFPDYFPFHRYSPSSPQLLPTSTPTIPPTIESSPRPPPLHLTNWIPRGIFYIFLSIICFEQSIVVRALDADRHASTSSRFFDGIFIVLSAWVMLIVGGTYVVFGIFCLQRVMERVRREEKERWDEYREEVERKERKLRADEERELLLESDDDCEGRVLSDEEGIGVMFCGKWERCRRKCLKKRRRGKGFFSQLAFRGVDWKC
mmetsp:Transcript_4361/g.8852  ORF Transcript_4361/g.8852 Transcript_4361/m.8852 type:complete len:408 (-) Transcript_4361:85-1308(-)